MHLPYGGPPRSQERHEHTANVAKVLDDFFQETRAFASVAVGDFNLDVFSVVHGMRTSPAQLSAAKMINNCQVWAGDKKSMRSTVDGAVGIEVLTSPNPSSYSIPYDGPSKSVFEKWLPFSKDK